MSAETQKKNRKWAKRTGLALSVFFFVTLAIVSTFPFGLVKGPIADRIGSALGTSVSIGSIERREFVSFSPTLVIKGLTVRQPSWAGRGNLLEAEGVEARVPVLPLLVGGSPKIDTITVSGPILALVRDHNGRANWEGPGSRKGDTSGRVSGLQKLIIENGRFSLRDDKRVLKLEGAFSSDRRGLVLDAKGTFHEAPAEVLFRGGGIVDPGANAPYPLRLEFASPLLHLRASGETQGALNLRSMTLDIRAKAPNLKYLDDVIEAGLFSSRPIDLSARVRHVGRDWFIDEMTGSIGRSVLSAKADILKRDGRTKIEAVTHFSTFDFDDLSDAEGKAKEQAVEARIGPRVLPGTRINLAKIGPTDGTIDFRADRLLLPNSMFRSLKGRISLQGKLLKVDGIVVGMEQGRMTGGLEVDQRNGAKKPTLALDLVVKDARLEAVLGSRDVSGPLRSRIALTGTGDTIREALGHADGRAGLVVEGGSVKRIFAAVLGQDLGKTLGSLLKDKKEVELRCLAIGFQARNGILRAETFVADTGISIGQGKGKLSLFDEGIALSIRGRARDPSALRLEDPIMVGGTFSAPTLSAAGRPPGSKVNVGSVVSAIGKSVGNALGLSGDDDEATIDLPAAVDCNAIARKVL